MHACGREDVASIKKNYVLTLRDQQTAEQPCPSQGSTKNKPKNICKIKPCTFENCSIPLYTCILSAGFTDSSPVGEDA